MNCIGSRQWHKGGAGWSLLMNGFADAWVGLCIGLDKGLASDNEVIAGIRSFDEVLMPSVWLTSTAS